MSVRGITKNVILSPKGYKNIDPEESLFPVRIDIRNGTLTDAGHWKKRPGYTQKTDLANDKPVTLLIPRDNGYAATSDGKVYGNVMLTKQELTEAFLSGGFRPTWLPYIDSSTVKGVIIADGGPPIKISDGVISLLAGSPSNFRYMDQISSYVLGCGHDDTEVKFCSSNNPQNWTTGDSGFFNVKKSGIIKNFKQNRDKGFFWKNNEIEVWYNRGGSTPFVKIEIIPKGLFASYSLVVETDTFYWLGDDFRLYRLDGNRPVPISSSYEDYIQKIPNASDVVGYVFAHEHLIKWVFGASGKVIVYDYKNDHISEDNKWTSGQWQRFPLNSYMELGGKRYFGSYDEDGLIHEISEDSLDDNGDPIRVYQRFSVKPSQSDNKSRFNRVGFRLKRAVATASVPAPVFGWRYRIDKGAWSTEDTVDMGAVGEHDPYISRNNLGVGVEIEFEIYCTDAVEFLMTGMELTARELGVDDA